MDNLPIHLAFHGVVIFTVSVSAGLFLYRSILKDTNKADWHLIHAGGSSRGIMLIALAAIIDLPALPLWLLSIIVWSIIFFSWTSTLAMLIRAFTGEKGFNYKGSNANKLVYSLYAMGTVVLFPALLVLIYGLFKNLSI